MKNETSKSAKGILMVPYRVDYQIGSERLFFSVVAVDSEDAFESVREYISRFPNASVIGSPVLEARK